MIFQKAGCDACHSGSDFTDGLKGIFHDDGTTLPSSGKRRNNSLEGFTLPTLKGIRETAPYLHGESAATLKDVMITKNKNSLHGNLKEISD